MLGRPLDWASIGDSRGRSNRSASRARIVGANVRRLLAAKYGGMRGFMATSLAMF